ncbi:MAG: YcbK family protein [Ignavibacteriales bacterium]
MKEILEKYNIINFSAGELMVKCRAPEELFINIIPTLCILQKMRSLINIPIIINSAYRSPEYNRRIRGSRNSLHMQFNAIDFRPAAYNSHMLKELYEDILRGDFLTEIEWKNGIVSIGPDIMGAGLYPGFIHIDTRGLLGRKCPARWRTLKY